jgi:hypothetical protein
MNNALVNPVKKMEKHCYKKMLLKNQTMPLSARTDRKSKNCKEE